MSRYYTLYKAIKSKCPNTFKGSFRTQKENSERTYGIYLKGGMPSDRRLQSGVYLQRSSHVLININGGKDVEGILAGYTFAEQVISALETTKNETFTDPETGEKVHIISVDIVGDVNDLGVNQFDIPAFSINLIVKYQGGLST